VNVDDYALDIIKTSASGMRFSEIRKSFGHNVSDKNLAAGLRRLVRYREIRKVLFFDGNKPTVIYVPEEKDNNRRVEIWLRREVLLEDGTQWYYDVFLDWSGDKVDHDLTRI
jgi:hypothetical protein